MTDAEFDRWCMVAHDCIIGRHVTIVCRDMRAARNDFRDCEAVFDLMGLAHRAYRAIGSQSLVVGDSIEDGGVDFSTMAKERMSCGDVRDLFDIPKTPHEPRNHGRPVSFVSEHYDFFG